MMKGFGGGMAQLMKQANQMQLRMKKMQEELAQRDYEGTAGGGAASVVVSGEYLVKSVVLSPEVVASADKDLLQDLFMTAANDAIQKAKDTSAEEMKKITGGLSIPGLG